MCSFALANLFLSLPINYLYKGIVLEEKATSGDSIKSSEGAGATSGEDMLGEVSHSFRYIFTSIDF